MHTLKARIISLVPLIRWLRLPRRIFMSMQGYANSLRQGRPVDANDEALPWYTYPAIEQLAQYDFSHARILEYGAGYSTIYWGRRAHSVVSIEHDRSITARANSAQLRATAAQPARVMPKRQSTATARIAASSSTSGYCRPMLLLQLAQRPRSNR